MGFTLPIVRLTTDQKRKRDFNEKTVCTGKASIADCTEDSENVGCRARIMGGPSKPEARQIILNLTGKAVVQ